MPAIRLNTAAVTSSQPPHTRAAARFLSVLGARMVPHSSAARAISAAGSSQLTWLPMSAAKSLVSPAVPPVAATPWPPGPPTEPVSLPSRRPNPL